METPNNIANQPLRLQVSDKPTYWNKEAAIGTLLFPIVGTAIGAVMGKNRMEHEFQHGKEIQEPTVFNKDLILGGLIGSFVTAIVGAIATVAAAFVMGGGDMYTVIQVAKTGIALTQWASIGGMLAGGYIGGESGKSDMAKEKSQAISQLQNYAMSQHFGKTQQPELSQEMDVPSKQFAKMVEDRREQTQGAGLNR